MIFDVTPEQVQRLKPDGLVELLRRLLHAEAQKTGLSLRAVSVPLQITIADGGEDGRVSWKGGAKKTDYFPSRFSIFQAKASALTPAGWKKEMWSRASRKKGAKRKLSPAIVKALEEKGSYVGFTTAAIVGTKADDFIAAIKQGIKAAGGDPSRLSGIDIYDANRIAAWASCHPSIAVWLNEMQSGLKLGGFQTIEGWGKSAEFTATKLVDDKKDRYRVVRGAGEAARENTLTCEQARERISDYLTDPRVSVRLAGPSGLGKSRFAYEMLRDPSTLAKRVNAGAAIFCDYRAVEGSLLAIANTLANQRANTLLVVDECPRDVAVALHSAARRSGSNLRVMSIDIDDNAILAEDVLSIGISRSDDALIEGILKQRLPAARDGEITYIRELCGGFPRIAVLASSGSDKHVLKSIKDVVERVLLGCAITDPDQVRAVECLALFDRLGADGDFAETFNAVARRLADTSGDRMFEQLALAAEHPVVDRRGRYLQVQPLPIAAYLGAKRVDLIRVSTLVRFITEADAATRQAMLRQFRLFDQTRHARAVAEELLAPVGVFGSLAAINSDDGAECVDALTHVAPDRVAGTLHRIFEHMSIDDMQAAKVRRGIVSSLAKLVFRERSFGVSAELLLRLAAAETDKWTNEATSHFQQLFHVQLSGTEVEPAERFAVLDAGLASADARVLDLCLGALENTISSGSISRTGGTEQIGTQPPLKDWAPKLWKDIFDFHRMGLKRLMELRGGQSRLKERIDKVLASNFRGLLHPNLIDELIEIVDTIVADRGVWLDAIEAIGDWLYFDREGASPEFAAKVRSLYDSLFPTDLVQRALLYTKYWSGDIRDPDVTYQQHEARGHDFEYSTRKAREVAAEIAKDPDATRRAVEAMSRERLHNVFPFADELAQRTSEPEAAVRDALRHLTETGGTQFIRGLLYGIDQRDKVLADRCAKLALETDALKKHAVDIYTALGVTPDRLAQVRAALREGRIQPNECVVLSYGRHLEPLSAAQLMPFIIELSEEHGATGLWSAMEIVSMYQLSRADVAAEVSAFALGALSSQKLLDKEAMADRDGHLLERMVAIARSGAVSKDVVAAGVTDLAIRLCQVSEHRTFTALDEPVRKLLGKVVDDAPSSVWESLARFYEIGSGSERRRLIELVGPDRFSFRSTPTVGGGPLAAVPLERAITWAKSDPAKRAPFLVEVFPMFSRLDGELHWHDAIEQLMKAFGKVHEVQDAVEARLYPRSWSGPLSHQLQILKSPLERWSAHSVGEVALWARKALERLEQRIASAREDEDED